MRSTLFTIAVISLLFVSCSKTPECNSNQTLKEGSCVCVDPFFGDQCQYEDECITTFQSCNGYECHESVCDCPDLLQGPYCDSIDIAFTDYTGMYYLKNWEGPRYGNLEINSLSIDSFNVMRNSWRPVDFKIDSFGFFNNRFTYFDEEAYYRNSVNMSDGFSLYSGLWLNSRNSMGVTVFAGVSEATLDEENREIIFHMTGNTKLYFVEYRSNRGGPETRIRRHEKISFDLVKHY